MASAPSRAKIVIVEIPSRPTPVINTRPIVAPKAAPA
ncbi:unnamed protein product, partial [marine sediment metagenome]